jgi:hypothetical protein
MTSLRHGVLSTVQSSQLGRRQQPLPDNQNGIERLPGGTQGKFVLFVPY